MKKYLFLISLCVLIFYILIFNNANSSLDYDILIDRIPSDKAFNLNLFYSDISMQHIKAFKLSKNKIIPLDVPFASYMEGFLPLKNSNNILLLVNQLRKSQGKTPYTYFRDYYEDDKTLLVAFEGDLQNIYIINKGNSQISTINYDSKDNLGPMYVLHIKRIGNHFILIGGEVNAYNTFIYTIDAASYTLVQAKKISTHPSAIYKEHATIDYLGNSIFIAGEGVDMLSSQTKELLHQQLPFEAQYVISDSSNTVVLSLNSDLAHYAVLGESSTHLDLGQLTLPNKNLILVKAVLSGNTLCMISYDPSGTRYSNYITVYDLNTEQLIYCVGLYPLRPLALVDTDFHSIFE